MFRQNQDMIRSNYICESYDKSDKCEIEKQEINKEAKTDFSSESQIIKTEKSRSIVENESQVNSETDKISQETIKENFPFPTFLKDQLEILTEIVDAIEEGYKYIILESGVGKSAIAATLANIYKSSFILSDNEKLQEKYHEEYDLINNDKFHVSNHSDAFNEFEKLDKRKLLIVDDAHKFDENIVDFFSYKIRLSAFDDELIDSFYCEVRNKEKKEIDVGLDFINHLSLGDEKVNRVKYNIEENPDDWIWFYDEFYGGMIIFKPLNLENILKKYLLNKAEICIFMSSTILNKEIFADELGLNISEVKFIHKDFPFSSDANQIYLRNSANMHWKYSQNVDLVIPFIEDILEKRM
jgi:Rad3-related DNA helicase